jgi:gentisate 1,2-dioxygenase
MPDNGKIIDATGVPAPAPDFWEPIIITGAEIDAEIERLASVPRPVNGRRESRFVHPQATSPGLGLAPGIEVKMSVLLPGEQTEPIRHNSTLVNFCIRGAGTTTIEGTHVAFSQFDVFNTPSYRTYVHANHTDELSARFTYSNAPLLEKLQVHLVEENPPTNRRTPASDQIESIDPTRVNPFGTFQLNDLGAMLMPYEVLINPPVAASSVLHWPWQEVKAHLDKLDELGDDYVGRRLYLLYNPMTGRTNGTTPSFFATITIRPPGVVDRPHRHVSAAINYYFKGHGYSRVAGKRYEWSAGDLMLSAPGWAIHNHASGDEQVYELTVQDQPLNIGMESLLWQEDLKRDAVILGSQVGFDTNRAGLPA